MKHTLVLLFIIISNITFAQGGALADLKFEEAEIAFNDKFYSLTISKLNEFDKMYGSVTSKSLYLRIVSEKKLFDLFYPETFYEDEKHLRSLNSLQKNVTAYLKAMEGEGLDDKYREVYKINEELKQYPKDKESWQIIKDKRTATSLEEKNRGEELGKKIDDWNFDNKIIKIGANFQEIISQHKHIKKGFKQYENSNIWYSKSFMVSSIVIKNDVIESYNMSLNSTTANNYLSQWENEFGKESISKFKDGDHIIYCLQSPYSKTVNIIKFFKAKYSWIEGKKESIDSYNYIIKRLYTKID